MKKFFVLIISILTMCLFWVGCNNGNNSDPPGPEPADEYYLYLDISETSIDIGETITLHIITDISDTSGCSWESSDTSVATVSEDGVVTSLSEGRSIITCKIGLNSATCRVNVYNSHSYPFISVNDTDLRLAVGQTYTIDAEVIYKNQAKDVVVTYKTEDGRIAEVSDSGIITAVSVGLVKITLSAQYDGVLLQQTINVAVLTDNLF